MSLLRTIPFNSSEEYTNTLDDLDFLAPMRNRFAIPEYNHTAAIYFASHERGLSPISVQYIYQSLYKKWNNYHLLQPEKWASVIHEYGQDATHQMGKLLNVAPALIGFDLDTQHLLNQIILDFPNISKCYSLSDTVPEIIQQYYIVDRITLAVSQQGTEGLIQYINDVIPANSLLYLPSIDFATGDLLCVEDVKAAATQKGIVILWEITLAVNNMDIDLVAANMMYAVFKTNAFLNGGPDAIYGFYAKNGFENAVEFPILNAASFLATLDLMNITSMKDIREKANRLITYFTLLQEELDSSIQIVTSADSIKWSGYFVLQVREGVYDFLIQHGVVVTAINPTHIALSFNAYYNRYYDVYAFYLLLKEYYRNVEN